MFAIGPDQLLTPGATVVESPWLARRRLAGRHSCDSPKITLDCLAPVSLRVLPRDVTDAIL
jgi:hypothetical protein